MVSGSEVKLMSNVVPRDQKKVGYEFHTTSEVTWLWNPMLGKDM